MYLNTSTLFNKQALIAFFVCSAVTLLPDFAYAATGAPTDTGDLITAGVLENVVKYGRWIGLVIIALAFFVVGYFSLRAYSAWADEDNRQGTMPRLIMVVLLGIFVFTIVTIFITKGISYLEDNLTTAYIEPAPVVETSIV